MAVAPVDVPSLKSPDANLENLKHPGQLGEACDLSTTDWEAGQGTIKRMPRFFHANVGGLVQGIPVGAPQTDMTGVIVLAVAGFPLYWSFRKILRAGTAAGLQVANGLVAVY